MLVFRSSITLLGVLVLVFLRQIQAPPPPVSVSTDLILTSCSASNDPSLPNLVSAGSSTAYDDYISCSYVSSTNVNYSASLTWNYYVTLPTTGGSCAHDTISSTLGVNSITWGSAVSKCKISDNLEVVTAGTVSAGPFSGKNFTLTNVYLGSSITQCPLSSTGMEALSGISTLIIVGGTTCTGIITAEYCPGLTPGI